jgi:tetratricopeptide (TPR) repeat protein
MNFLRWHWLPLLLLLVGTVGFGWRMATPRHEVEATSLPPALSVTSPTAVTLPPALWSYSTRPPRRVSEKDITALIDQALPSLRGWPEDFWQIPAANRHRALFWSQEELQDMVGQLRTQISALRLTENHDPFEMRMLQDALASNLGKLGQLEEASQLFTEALAWKNQHFGFEHEETQVSYYQIGEMLMTHGGWERLRAFYEAELTAHPSARTAAGIPGLQDYYRTVRAMNHPSFYADWTRWLAARGIRPE